MVIDVLLIVVVIATIAALDLLAQLISNLCSRL